MSERLGDAVLELRTDDSRYLSGLRSAEQRGRRFEAGLRRLSARARALGDRLAGLGRRLSLAITAPLAAVAALGVKAASDVQELGNLIAVTFGRATEDIRAWAAATARAVGRSRFELLRAAGDFAAFLKPLGVAPDLVVPMSKALAQLTTDISSFRNKAEPEVFAALFSGLAGETEAVRRLGIDIGQAAVEQELLNLGIEGGIKAATQAEKVLARYNLIVAQTRDAQGDAARTSGSFENRMRALSATVFDVRVAIGRQLLPVATRAVGFLTRLGQAFVDLGDRAQRTIVILGGVAAAVGPGLLALGLFAKGVSLVVAGVIALGKTIQLVFSVAFLRGLLRRFGILLRTIAAGIAKLVTALATLGAISPELRRTIVSALEGVGDFVDDVFTAVRDFNAELQSLQNKAADSAEGIDALFRRIPSAAGGAAAGVGALTAEVDELKDRTEATRDAAEELGLVFTSATEDALVRLQSLRDVAVGFFRDLQRLILQQTVTRPLLGALTGTFGSIFGGPQPVLFTSQGAGVLPGPTALAGPFHTGGVVGRDTVGARLVDPRVFRDAPRFRSGGILPGEMPAVLHRGEGVFTPAQMAALAPAGRGDTFFVDARGADRRGFEELRRLILRINGSIEQRAVAGVVQARRRDPRLFGFSGTLG